MKKIELKSIKINSFKGISSFEMDLGSKRTKISARNGFGKTTIYDAFLWLLTGKNSNDQANFEIYPTINNEIVKQSTPRVIAKFKIDDSEFELTREYHQKWTKSKGSVIPIYTGNETKFGINDNLAIRESEFKSFVDENFDIETLKYVTSLNFFFDKKEAEKREFLCKVVGIPSDKELLEEPRFSELKNDISLSSIDQYKRDKASKIKNLNEELKTIAPKIETHTSTLNNIGDIDIPALKKEKEVLSNEKELINSQIADQSSALAKKNSERLDKIYQLQSKLKEKKRELEEKEKQRVKNLNSEYNSKNDEYHEMELTLKNCNSRLTTANAESNSIEIEIKSSLDQYHIILDQYKKLKNSIGETTDILSCPIDNNPCGCPIRGKSISHEEKEKRLKDIQSNMENLKLKGSVHKERYEELKIKFENKSKEIASIEAEISSFTEKLNRLALEINSFTPAVEENITYDNQELKSITEEIKLIEAEELSKEDFSSEKLKVKELEERISAISDLLANEKNINYNKEEIIRLEKQAKEISQLIADKQRQENLAKEFISYKSRLIEDKMEDVFGDSLIRFKMSDVLFTGDTIDCCKAMNQKGILYESCSTGERINISLDFIRIISEKIGVVAPIFIDNSEAVTDWVYTSGESQIIELRADENIPKNEYRIENL